ncbi:SPC3 Signal peptidase complex subunit 3 [Candida maltosa Xu316]|uniref:Signal peptidase subunit 3 n=1 Tax=Candida maltosa (strain Xu316) TaxID=1245528 RepID=M3HFQ5_CANMX|nr:Microsomal signal peptidase subunit, putative [Candida maltosa Xu316]
MFNLVSRAQAAANVALTSSIVISSVVILLTLLQLYRDNVWSLDTTSISNIKPTASIKKSFQYGSLNRNPKENAKIQFDLHTDLTPLFNWNTKQIFVYLTAEYPGKSEGSSNKVTFWDKIITDKQNAKLDLINQRGKYSVWDVEKSFRGRNATVKLEWNIQPYIGPLIFGETETTGEFQFLDSKKKPVVKSD